MKLKASKKEIKQGYHQIIGVSYCAMQHLLNYYSPFAYSTRREGWVCDYYDVKGICISTGYSYIDSKNTLKDNYDIIKKYENKAYGKTKKEIEVLLFELIEELKNKGIK